jgi:hypothetical protein
VFASRLRELAECLGDGLITVAGSVLVDHGGARTGVAEPGHQFFEGRASPAARARPEARPGTRAANLCKRTGTNQESGKR